MANRILPGPRKNNRACLGHDRNRGAQGHPRRAASGRVCVMCPKLREKCGQRISLRPITDACRRAAPTSTRTARLHLASRMPTTVEPWSDFGDARTERPLPAPPPATGTRTWPACDRHRASQMPRPGSAGVPPARAEGPSWTARRRPAMDVPPKVHPCVQAGRMPPLPGALRARAQGEHPSMTSASTPAPTPAPTLGGRTPPCYRPRRGARDDARVLPPPRTRP